MEEQVTNEWKEAPLKQKVKMAVSWIADPTVQQLACPIYFAVPIASSTVEALQGAYYEQAVPPKAALKGFRVGHVSREVAIQKMGGPKAFFEPLYAEVAKGLLAKRGFEAAVFDNLRLEGNEKEGYTLRATVYKTPQVILPEDLSFLGEIVVPPVDELAVQSLIDKAVKATLGNFAVIEPA